MPAFAPDTSVIIATLCSWHERHEWARDAMSERLDRGMDLVLAAHSLVESYSVLTRLPPPHRLSPVVTADLLHRNLAAVGKVVGLPARDLWSLIRGAPALGVAGGGIYDAVIAASAERGGARELLTLNPSHFEGLLGDRVEITAP